MCWCVSENLPMSAEITTIAVPLTELADNSCHWPVAGHGLDMLFGGADGNGSSHVSYCRHHAARSIRIDQPVMPFIRPRMVAAW